MSDDARGDGLIGRRILALGLPDMALLHFSVEGGWLTPEQVACLLRSFAPKLGLRADEVFARLDALLEWIADEAPPRS